MILHVKLYLPVKLMVCFLFIRTVNKEFLFLMRVYQSHYITTMEWRIKWCSMINYVLTNKFLFKTIF